MSAAASNRQPRHILLVEDEPSMQEVLCLLLEDEGYAVSRASNGREGLARVAQRRPDLILTDHLMPRMTGLEMIEHLRADPGTAAIPILLMSAAPPAGREGAAEAFLAKPMNIDVLLREVRRLLEDTPA